MATKKNLKGGIRKPKDKDEAIWMLNFLSDRTHQVYTGFTIIEKPTNQIISDYDITDVTFRKLDQWEIEKYKRH